MALDIIEVCTEDEICSVCQIQANKISTPHTDVMALNNGKFYCKICLLKMAEGNTAWDILLRLGSRIKKLGDEVLLFNIQKAGFLKWEKSVTSILEEIINQGSISIENEIFQNYKKENGIQ